MAGKMIMEIRVGIFVTAGLLLAMLVIFTVGSEHRILQREYALYADFDNISGLRTGAVVQLAGLKVGYVDKIQFASDLQKRQITVVMQILEKFQDRIRADSVATVETQGLLGDKYIYISMGSEEAAVIPDEGVIASKETVSIFSLAEKAGGIMEDIGKAAEAINGMLTSVRGEKQEGDIKAIISSIRKSVEQLEKGKGLLHALFYDQSGESVINNLSDTLKIIHEIGVGAEIKGNADGMIVNLRRASEDLRKILESVRNSEGTLGRLVNDPSVYDDLRTFLGRANRNSLLRAVVRSTLDENDRQLLK